MKLKTLAIAIAMGSVPFAAQAELKIGGDITVGYHGSAAGVKKIGTNGSEINVDASEVVGGTTFYGHTEIDFADDSNVSAAFDEVRVGAKGSWGDFTIGDIGDACDQLMVGGYPDQFLAPMQGGCKTPGQANISYKRSMGAATVAVTHSPDGLKYNSAAIVGKVGPVQASLGYEAGDQLAADDKNVILGMTGTVGPLAVGVRANKADSYNDAAVGINASYTAGANKFYAGFGNNESKVEGWGVGYNRTIGSKTTFIFEARDSDLPTQTDTEFGVGLKHAF